MSFTFRLKYNLGLISSADQLDAKWGKLIKMRDELLELERSDELKRYEELNDLLNSVSFKLKKQEIEGLRYAGSPEEKLVLEHKALAGSKSVKNYQKVSASGDLARYNRISEGAELKRYLELKKVVESGEFRRRKATHSAKEFAASPDFAIYQEYKGLEKKDDIRFWNKFGHSEPYSNYQRTAESKELPRLEELKKVIASPEFVAQVAYLKDKNRFRKSEEYKAIQQFKALDKSSMMAEYRKLKKMKALEFFDKWDIVLDENFTEKELNQERWQPEHWWGFKMTGSSFSQEGELQSFHGVRNIEIRNNRLSLLARKEKVMGKVWNPGVGLIPRQHDYSSSILNTADSFRIREGVVEAKVRFKKDATIISAFSLTGEKPFPQIDLFRSSKEGVGMGILEKHHSHSGKYLNFKGLKDDHFHIYRLEVFNNVLVWKINNHEVFRSTLTIHEPMFFNLLTSLHGKVNEQLLPHQFEIDWIRCFALKA